MILVSTNGLTISQHFCSGELVKSAILYKVEKCEHEVIEMTCCEKRAAEKKLATCGLNKTKSCCDDKVVFVQVDEEAQTLFVDFQQVLPIFVATIPIENLQFQEILPYFSPKYFNYKPPLIVEDDIEVLFETFLC
ncbi:MAG: hypothetical protein AB8G11_04855 [Saprospiraceae bacterium]